MIYIHTYTHNDFIVIKWLLGVDFSYKILAILMPRYNILSYVDIDPFALHALHFLIER